MRWSRFAEGLNTAANRFFSAVARASAFAASLKPAFGAASYARDDGRIDEALAMLRESLAILMDVDDRLGIGENLARFARVFAVAGRSDAAAELLAGPEVLYEETGAGVLAWVAELNEATLFLIRRRLSDEAVADAFERGRRLTVDEAVALALDG